MKKLVLAIALVLSPVAIAQTPGVKDLTKAADKEAKKAEKDAKKEADKAAHDAEKAAKKEAKAALKVDLAATVATTGHHTKLTAALTAAGLVDHFAKATGQTTLFAPTDEAFAKIPAADLEALLKDKAKLTAVLKGHAVAGAHKAASLKAGKVKTEAGTEVEVASKDGKHTFGGATVTHADVEATNGIIHSIDAVVLK